MKKIYISILVALLIFSCQKQEEISADSIYVATIKTSLRDSLSSEGFSTLDFNRAVLSEIDSVDLYYLRIPIKGKDIKNDFLVVKANSRGIIEGGKWVHINGNASTNNQWSGRITISSLKKESTMASLIEAGYITAFHPELTGDVQKMAPIYPDPYVELPEVVVVGYINNSGGISYSDWVTLQGLYDYGGGSGDISGYYVPMSGRGGTGTSTTGGIQTSEVIKIDFENQFQNPAIDLNAYLKCFANILDAGATCTIKILTDIPVDDNPNEFFDWHNGSPGHTFIQLEKVNGSQVAFQNIGFYPKIGWKTAASTAPLPGKFVDNSKHEYNASLQMNITPAQLQSVITEMQYLAKFVKYDIDEYNCTDWALEVFNYARHPSNQLIIPKFDLPYCEAPTGSNTPEGLYLKLQQMKKDNSPEANNISIGFKKAFVGTSTGPCN